METGGFSLIIGIGIAVITISFMLDHIWAKAIPFHTIYYIMRAPGVILHECAHIIGCILTGARIRNVVFFSHDGGSVTYARPLLPYIGDVVISTSPLFVIPLILSVFTWIFATYLGCIFPVFPTIIDSPGTLMALVTGIVSAITTNLITRFNFWFIVYLYLTISLVLSVAPSAQDLRNAAIGVFLIVLAGIMIIWSGIPVAQKILSEFMQFLGIGFTLGLVYGLIALLISFPLIVWYGYSHT